MQYQLGHHGLTWFDASFLLVGAVRTVEMAVAAAIVGTLLGVPLGWLRAMSTPARLLSAPFIDILRSVPMIIQLILVNSFLSSMEVPTSPFLFGALALSLWMAAVTAEVARASFLGVPQQFQKSGRSLGMSRFQELVHVSGPLAFRIGLPAWIGLVLSLTKDTALAGVIGYVEFLRSAQTLIVRTHETLFLLGIVGLFYFVICYPISRYSRNLEKRVLS